MPRSPALRLPATLGGLSTSSGPCSVNIAKHKGSAGVRRPWSPLAQTQFIKQPAHVIAVVMYVELTLMAAAYAHRQ
jgi:hypothetical protein